VEVGANELVAKMYEFCRALEQPCRMQVSSRTEPEPRDYVTWCFSNPLNARAFRKAFGGVLVTVTDD
jgi:hypothetical protein